MIEKREGFKIKIEVLIEKKEGFKRIPTGRQGYWFTTCMRAWLSTWKNSRL